MVVASKLLANFNAEELRDLVTQLTRQTGEHAKAIVGKDGEIKYRQVKIDQFTHEMAVFKRWKFGRSREQLDSAQASLLDEAIDADIAAIALELEHLAPAPKAPADIRQLPKRAALPPKPPRIDQHHEPESTTCTTTGCGCTLKRIGEDLSEELDYTPGLFTVERRIRGKWACVQCQSVIQALVPEQIIDKGSRQPVCWPRCWWPSTRITSRCTARKVFSNLKDLSTNVSVCSFNGLRHWLWPQQHLRLAGTASCRIFNFFDQAALPEAVHWCSKSASRVA